MLVEYQPCCVLTMKIKYFLLTFLKVSCRKILIPWKANWHSCWFFRIFIVQWNWPIKSYQGNIIFYLCWVIIFMFDDFAYFSWYDFSIAISIAAVRIGWYLVFSQHNFTENQVCIDMDKHFLKLLHIRFCSFKLFSHKLSCGTVDCQLGWSGTLLVFHRNINQTSKILSDHTDYRSEAKIFIFRAKVFWSDFVKNINFFGRRKFWQYILDMCKYFVEIF